MRSASICVFPEPAPASTRMFVSSSSRISRRDSRSIARDSVMCGKPPVRLEFGILKLGTRLLVHAVTTRCGIIAVPAVVLVRRANELSLDNQVAQISEHAGDRSPRRLRDAPAFLTALATREVIDARLDGRIRVP